MRSHAVTTSILCDAELRSKTKRNFLSSPPQKYPEQMATDHVTFHTNNDIVYTWMNSPKAFYGNRKSTSNRSPTVPANRSRIIKGSNYSHTRTEIQFTSNCPCISEYDSQRRQEVGRRFIDPKKHNIIGDAPVAGRRHEIIQTENYLEEIHNRPIQKITGCQTELYLYQNPPPPYIAAQIGVDVGTEIDEDELFDFDAEREKFVDNLVAKTITEAAGEVIEEEELADLRREKLKFMALREIELNEIKRLEIEKLIFDAERKRKTAMQLVVEKLNVLLQEETDLAGAIEDRCNEIVTDVVNDAKEAIEEKQENNIKHAIEAFLTEDIVNDFCQGASAEEILRLILADIIEERVKVHVFESEK